MRTLGLTVSALALLLPVAAMAGPSVAIDFDFDTDGNAISAPSLFADTTALTDLYAAWGVNFAGVQPGDGGAILDQAGNFGVDARSGRNFLAFNRNVNYLSYWPKDPEYITFDRPWCSVSIWGAGSSNPLYLDAFDADGNLLGSDSTSTFDWEELAFSSATGISKIKLYGSQDTAFVFDDLSGELCDDNPSTPELSTWALLACSGLAGVVLRRRRRA